MLNGLSLDGGNKDISRSDSAVRNLYQQHFVGSQDLTQVDLHDDISLQ